MECKPLQRYINHLSCFLYCFQNTVLKLFSILLAFLSNRSHSINSKNYLIFRLTNEDTIVLLMNFCQLFVDLFKPCFTIDSKLIFVQSTSNISDDGSTCSASCSLIDFNVSELLVFRGESLESCDSCNENTSYIHLHTNVHYTVTQASYSTLYKHTCICIQTHPQTLINTHRYMMVSRVVVLGFAAVEAKTLSFLC